LDPNYRLISRHSLRDNTVDAALKTLNKLKLLLPTWTDWIAITSDGWTDQAQNPYLCVTAHFFNKQSQKLESRILGAVYSPEGHTAEEIEAKIQVIIEILILNSRKFLTNSLIQNLQKFKLVQ
jgi:hypothetical protein